MNKTMMVECQDCGFEQEVACETDYHDDTGEPYSYMSDEFEECEECGECLCGTGGGMSDYQERMWERKQMGLSNF